MEYKVNETTGLVTYFFDGIVWDNCTRDGDCPGSAYCLMNQTTWLSAPYMCACSPAWGTTGKQCENETLGNRFGFACNIISAICCFVFLSLGLYVLAQIMCISRNARKKTRADSLLVTLVVSILALWSSGMVTVFTANLYNVATQRLIDPITGQRQEPFAAFIRATISLTYLFSVVALLNVSFVWISVTNRAIRGKSAISRNVQRHFTFYKAVFFTYYATLFAIEVIACNLENNLTLAAVATLPGALFIIIAYFVAFLKLRAVRSRYAVAHVGHGNDADEASRRLNSALRPIQYTAISLSVITFLFACCLGIWVLLGGYTPSRPDGTAGMVILGLAWICAAVLNSIVMTYVLLTFRNRFRQHTSSTIKNDNASNIASSLYVGEVNHGATPVSTHVRIKSLRVPRDPLVPRLLAMLSTCKIVILFTIPIVYLASAVLDTLLLIGVFESSTMKSTISIAVFVLNAAVWSPLILGGLSSSIVRRLLRLTAVWIRVIVNLLFLGFLASALQDERILAVFGCLLFPIVIALFSDAIILESTDGLPVVVALKVMAILSLLRILVLLQFDLISARKNVDIDIISSSGAFTSVHWSTYQAARDFGFALWVLAIFDTPWTHSTRQYFVHIRSAINVRIVGIARGKKRVVSANQVVVVMSPLDDVSAQQEATLLEPQSLRTRRRFTDWTDAYALGVSTAKLARNLAYVDCIVLKESDSLLARLLGPATAGPLLHLAGFPHVRWLNTMLLSVPIFVYVCFVLTGLLPSIYVYVVCLTCIPLVRSALLKNLRLVSILMRKLDFVISATFAIAVLCVFGAILGDERAAAIPFLFWLWLDIRLTDARCVFFHSRHHSFYFSGRGCLDSIPYALEMAFGLVFVFSILAFPAVLVLQAIPHLGSPDLSFRVRDVDASSPLDPPAGSFATVRLLQFVSDFVLTFSLAASLEVLVDVTRSKSAPVRFRNLQAPVLKEYSAAENTDISHEPQTVHHSATSRTQNNDPLSHYTVVFSDEADEFQQEEDLISAANATEVPQISQGNIRNHRLGYMTEVTIHDDTDDEGEEEADEDMTAVKSVKS